MKNVRFETVDELVASIKDIKPSEQKLFLERSKKNARIISLGALAELKLETDSQGKPRSFRDLAARESSTFSPREWADALTEDPSLTSNPKAQEALTIFLSDSDSVSRVFGEVTDIAAARTLHRELTGDLPMAVSDVAKYVKSSPFLAGVHDEVHGVNELAFKAFTGLPKHIRKNLLSEELSYRIRLMVDDGVILKQQSEAIARITFLATLGQINSQDLPAFIRQRLGVDAEQGKAIADRVASDLLEYIEPQGLPKVDVPKATQEAPTTSKQISPQGGMPSGKPERTAETPPEAAEQAPGQAAGQTPAPAKTQAPVETAGPDMESPAGEETDTMIGGRPSSSEPVSRQAPAQRTPSPTVRTGGPGHAPSRTTLSARPLPTRPTAGPAAPGGSTPVPPTGRKLTPTPAGRSPVVEPGGTPLRKISGGALGPRPGGAAGRTAHMADIRKRFDPMQAARTAGRFRKAGGGPDANKMIEREMKITGAIIKRLKQQENHVRKLATQYKRKQRRRTFSLIPFRIVLRPLYLLFVGGMIMAVSADIVGLLSLILSFIPGVGWVLDILSSAIQYIFVLPLIWFAMVHMNFMGRLTGRLRAKFVQDKQELQNTITRLRPLILRTRNIQMLALARGFSAREFVVFQSRLILNIVVTAALELIPIVKSGPWMTLRLGSSWVRHNKMYRRNKAQMLKIGQMHSRTKRLENFEVRAYTREIAKARRAMALRTQQLQKIALRYAEEGNAPEVRKALREDVVDASKGIANTTPSGGKEGKKKQKAATAGTAAPGQKPKQLPVPGGAPVMAPA